VVCYGSSLKFLRNVPSRPKNKPNKYPARIVPEDGGGTFLRNIDELYYTTYTV
jgi:hypothetical protein